MIARSELHAIDIVDMRADRSNPPRVGERKLGRERRGRIVERDPSEVDGITLHQTACDFVGPYRYRRALHVAAHAVTYRDGVVCLVSPPSWYMHHAGRLNRTTLGLECVGLFSGLLDRNETPQREDLDTTWQNRIPAVLDEFAIETYRRGLRALVEDGRRWGADLRYLYAHRQSSATRRSDPGEGIWRALAPYARRELGLALRCGYVIGDGRPIPLEWDPSGVGHY